MQNLHGSFCDGWQWRFDFKSNQGNFKSRFLSLPFQNARVFENRG